MQVQSGSGPIIVDSPVKYLTLERGCEPLDNLLSHVKTRVLYIQAFMFQDSDIIDSPECAPGGCHGTVPCADLAFLWREGQSSALWPCMQEHL